MQASCNTVGEFIESCRCGIRELRAIQEELEMMRYGSEDILGYEVASRVPFFAELAARCVDAAACALYEAANLAPTAPRLDVSGAAPRVLKAWSFSEDGEIAEDLQG